VVGIAIMTRVSVAKKRRRIAARARFEAPSITHVPGPDPPRSVVFRLPPPSDGQCSFWSVPMKLEPFVPAPSTARRPFVLLETHGVRAQR
jgi:hypothetical protein